MGSRLIARDALHNKAGQLAKYALDGGEYASATAVISKWKLKDLNVLD